MMNLHSGCLAGCRPFDNKAYIRRNTRSPTVLKQTIAFIATCCLITNVLAITTTPDPEPVPDTGSGGAIDDGRYVFINRFSNRAMEVVNASSQSG